MRMLTIPRCLTLALLLAAAPALSAPPLGLTQISSTSDDQSKLAVIDGVAYVSNRSGVTPVVSSGLLPTILPLSSVFQAPISATRVVKGGDGDLYYGFNYESGGDFGDGGSDLVRLQGSTNTTIASWDVLHALGFDSSLNGIGCINGNCFGDFASRRLLLNGDSAPLPELWFDTVEVTPSGLAIGDAGIPGTLGAAPAVIDGDDQISFLSTHGRLLSGRERLDGGGINFAWDGGSNLTMFYPGQSPIPVEGAGGEGTSVRVSGSDFAVAYTEAMEFSIAYYPGISPAGDNVAIPLLDYFPELTSLDFDEIADITSADGQIHLLLSGNDGLWLYVADDPTVVPEPACLALALLAIFGAPRPRANA